VAVMYNSAQANPTQLGRETVRLWTGGVPTPNPAPVAVQTATLEKMAGMYRKVRDNTVAELRVRDGKLMFDTLTLIPLGAAEFGAGQDRYLFEDGCLNLVTPDGEIAYERVEPAHQSDSELAILAGKYGEHAYRRGEGRRVDARHRVEQTSPSATDLPRRVHDGDRGWCNVDRFPPRSGRQGDWIERRRRPRLGSPLHSGSGDSG
jgi:hypothetical protein